ncbi:MAG: twin-arginine translocation pathway signal [Flavobacteriaceae bacterium]|nr:twin-arginine translocation pathway signal [Flavobacteriaceae bacterium]MBD09830.1 twin-arginine translocation pathway signal [Flavobacteriaceae bacterium]|tara:strand:- start:2641 stop:3828 length:1188 start_codon:yes stop_codon:yes gene_type:complete
MDRRKFLKDSALASSLLFVPSFLKAFESVDATRLGYKRLVIVQLSGGNDGLNTIIPYNNDIYYNSRPRLAITKDIIKMTDDLGFHSSLAPLRSLFDNGELSILNNVGYPNPVRSHFRSMDIWQTASNSNQYLQSGWLGRYMDMYGKKPYNAIEMDEQLSLAMKGEHFNGIATNDYKVLYRTAKDPFFESVHNHYNDAHLNEHNLGYLYQTMIEAKSSAKYIYENTKVKLSQQDYPKNALAKQLKNVAQFINSNIDTKVFYTSLGGFDTHANQQDKQARLLSQYAESISSFVKDLKQNGTFKDTLILTFSEFGRRVKQNAANGTDHGAANNVFVIGKNLKQAGFYNNLASLKDLDSNGDLKYEIDFRTVYATILSKWLNANDEVVLNQNFKKLSFI